MIQTNIRFWITRILMVVISDNDNQFFLGWNNNNSEASLWQDDAIRAPHCDDEWFCDSRRKYPCCLRFVWGTDTLTFNVRESI